MEIATIRKQGRMKVVTIPINSKMQVGDPVKIFKINSKVTAE